jgi:hypothetical protein
MKRLDDLVMDLEQAKQTCHELMRSHNDSDTFLVANRIMVWMEEFLDEIKAHEDKNNEAK